MRGVVKDVRGAVYVEFLLVFLPVWMFFLAILQLGFVYAGRLVVQHAATRAARAAVVVIDDDPARYGGEPRGRVDMSGSADTESPLEAFLAGTGLGDGGGDAPGASRFRDIKSAATIPLLAIAPSEAQLDEPDSIGLAIGVGGERAASGASRYNRAAVAVTFPTSPGSNSFRTRFEKDELVTVRVTYLLHCAMPLVPQLMCDGPARLRARLTSEEEAQIDLDFLQEDVANARFLVLRSEATLRNQGAGYRYAGEP